MFRTPLAPTSPAHAISSPARKKRRTMSPSVNKLRSAFESISISNDPEKENAENAETLPLQPTSAVGDGTKKRKRASIKGRRVSFSSNVAFRTFIAHGDKQDREDVTKTLPSISPSQSFDTSLSSPAKPAAPPTAKKPAPNVFSSIAEIISEMEGDESHTTPPEAPPTARSPAPSSAAIKHEVSTTDDDNKTKVFGSGRGGVGDGDTIEFTRSWGRISESSTAADLFESQPADIDEVDAPTVNVTKVMRGTGEAMDIPRNWGTIAETASPYRTATLSKLPAAIDKTLNITRVFGEAAMEMTQSYGTIAAARNSTPTRATPTRPTPTRATPSKSTMALSPSRLASSSRRRSLVDTGDITEPAKPVPAASDRTLVFGNDVAMEMTNNLGLITAMKPDSLLDDEDDAIDQGIVDHGDSTMNVTRLMHGNGEGMEMTTNVGKITSSSEQYESTRTFGTIHSDGAAMELTNNYGAIAADAAVVSTPSRNTTAAALPAASPMVTGELPLAATPTRRIAATDGSMSYTDFMLLANLTFFDKGTTNRQRFSIRYREPPRSLCERLKIECLVKPELVLYEAGCTKLQHAAADLRQSASEMEVQLGMHNPPIFGRLQAASRTELEGLQESLKRLKNVAKQEAIVQWIRYRERMEQKRENALKEQLEAVRMEHDKIKARLAEVDRLKRTIDTVDLSASAVAASSTPSKSRAAAKAAENEDRKREDARNAAEIHAVLAGLQLWRPLRMTSSAVTLAYPVKGTDGELSLVLDITMATGQVTAATLTPCYAEPPKRGGALSPSARQFWAALLDASGVVGLVQQLTSVKHVAPAVREITARLSRLDIFGAELDRLLWKQRRTVRLLVDTGLPTTEVEFVHVGSSPATSSKVIARFAIPAAYPFGKLSFVGARVLFGRLSEEAVNEVAAAECKQPGYGRLTRICEAVDHLLAAGSYV